MSLWSSLRSLLFGAPRKPRLEGRFEVVPGLTVSAIRHSINTQSGDLQCCSFITEGLTAHGQKELVLTLRVTPGAMDETFSQRLGMYFAMVKDLAAQGRTVGVGDITSFGPRRPFPGRHLLYTQAWPWPGVPIPRDALSIQLITEKELELVQRCGPARVMSALGKMTSHYPCPPWSDLQRPELPAAAMLEHSLLAKFGGVCIWEVRVLQLGDDIVLRVPPALQTEFRQQFEQMPEDAALSLLTGIDRTADACLTWEPGQREPSAITPPGSKGEQISGCFLMIVPGQQEELGQLREDGFIWMLSDTSWKAVKHALSEGQALALIVGGKRLRIEWVAA